MGVGHPRDRFGNFGQPDIRSSRLATGDKVLAVDDNQACAGALHAQPTEHIHRAPAGASWRDHL